MKISCPKGKNLKDGSPSQTSLRHKIGRDSELPKQGQALHRRPQLNTPGELGQGARVWLRQEGSFTVLFLQKTK